MSVVDDKLLGLMSGKMAYLSQRQAVLAQNVANADTPGYKAKDLSPYTFESAVKQAQTGMAVTNPAHIIPASMAGVNAKTIKTASAETLPSGNNVELEQQALQVSRTAVDYQAMTAMYKKVTSWFRMALGRSGAS